MVDLENISAYCIFNNAKEKIDGQIKGIRLTDAESIGMLFDDPYDYEEIREMFVEKQEKSGE